MVTQQSTWDKGHKMELFIVPGFPRDKDMVHGRGLSVHVVGYCGMGEGCHILLNILINS